jgi:hypothetical protein
MFFPLCSRRDYIRDFPSTFLPSGREDGTVNRIHAIDAQSRIRDARVTFMFPDIEMYNLAKQALQNFPNSQAATSRNRVTLDNLLCC